ncbi:MAG: glutamate--cysteine ligase [Comamonas sp.]
MSRLHDRLQDRLTALTAARLQGMRRGIEKESLRALPDGELALTPHPPELGSPLTHPAITTDFSESQIEIVTGAHTRVEATLAELEDLHRQVYRVLAARGDETLWLSSMPCRLPSDENIPIGRYGTSNVGRAKSVYRMGLSHRYGRRMQTISGIHYNWSLPDVSSEDYFGLIRNFRRDAAVLLYLFGASPALCGSFLAAREHSLQPLGERSLYRPHATSLRMGRLGYQSDAQSALAVSYNDLDGYGASLQDALTRPYPPYETVGVRNPGGDYSQLSTTLLQIENEFYGTIRPKRTVFPGERPLHALRERGVQYVEVRCMDLDPFEPLGIGAATARFLDVFLLHCLLADSPPDTPAEIEALNRNQQLAAERGREPGLLFWRAGRQVTMPDWSRDLIAQCRQIAARVDELLGGEAYTQAVESVAQGAADPARLPSARVLAAIDGQHDGSFMAFSRQQSAQAREQLLSPPLPAEAIAAFARDAAASFEAQKEIEAGDTLPFEQYRQQYLQPNRLGFKSVPPAIDPALGAASATAAR